MQKWCAKKNSRLVIGTERNSYLYEEADQWNLELFGPARTVASVYLHLSTCLLIKPVKNNS